MPRSQINRLTDVFTRPMTQTQMMKVSGLSCAVISRYMSQLHESNQAHIGGWMKNRHYKPMVVWHPGPGQDVACPFVPKTSTERSRKLRAGMTETQRKELRRQKRDYAKRAYYRTRPVRRDPLFAMFFGASANEDRIHLPARSA